MCQAENRYQQAERLQRQAEHFRGLAKAELQQAVKLEERAWQWARDLEQGRLRAQEVARQAVAQREAQEAAVVQAEVRRRVEEARRELARRDLAAAALVDLQALPREEEEAAAVAVEVGRQPLQQERRVRFRLPTEQ